MPAPIRQLNVGEASKDNRVDVAVQAAVCSRVRDISYAGVRVRDMDMKLERAVGLVVASCSCYHAHRETLRKCNPRSCPFDTMRPAFMWASSLSTASCLSQSSNLTATLKIRPHKSRGCRKYRSEEAKNTQYSNPSAPKYVSRPLRPATYQIQQSGCETCRDSEQPRGVVRKSESNGRLESPATPRTIERRGLVQGKIAFFSCNGTP